ncbi:MAG: GIY-YIG nuclease family protein [Candidatus Omnitrophota bacterium]
MSGVRDLESNIFFEMDKTIYTDPWFVYVAECRDKTLYVGVAKDAAKRIKEHNTTNKCRYTRFRKPLLLVYKELCSCYNSARKREKQIKKFSRTKKLALIKK